MFFSAFKLPNRYKLLIGFSKWFLLFSFIIRIIFIFWKFDEVSLNPIYLIKTIGYGIFFDIGVVSFIWLFSTFYITLLPNKWIGSIADKILIYTFFALTILILIFTFFAEITFWDEFKSRFNFVAVDYLIYTFEVVQNINQSYPLIILIPSMLFIAFLVFYYFVKKEYFKSVFQDKIPFSTRVVPFVTVITINLIYVFFINNADAEWSKNRFNNEISKAGIYSFFAELRNNKLDFPTFYSTVSNEEAFTLVRSNLAEPNSKFIANDYSVKRKISDTLDTNQKPNVIFILIESMSAEFMKEFGNDKAITPFMDELAQKSLLFTNLYATGTRTVRGMEAVTLSIPPTPGSSIVKRPDNAGLFTISNVFKERNYQCNFFYGGDGYFDNMNAFYGGNGFDIYDRGRGSVLSDDIKTTRHNIDDNEVTFENAWGICDEDIYNKVIKVADEQHAKGKSFFNFVMTTSNHKPYTYPEKKIVIASGTGRNGAVQYSDYAIKHLFEKAKDKPWFKNTIFVLVADHCASSAGKDEIDVKNYHIPAIIFGARVPVQKVDKLCSQIDLFPTLFGVLNWNYTSDFFGKNVLASTFEERTFMGTYLKLAMMKKDNSVMILSNQKKEHQYRWNKKDNSLKNVPLNLNFKEETTAFYQSADYLFSNHLLN
ncbi:LTA synthase family protein [Flavobacterium sp.]|uniref:LTA synthase family protein n=1 Tax=Flavobacterium sp. TaxID=239 RepID=UPI0025BF5A7C|nr:alkaline phosphatase family protein [Flavobacterium sp.]MBA4154696.1 sulfatase [Flavobacterium sp.]